MQGGYRGQGIRVKLETLDGFDVIRPITLTLPGGIGDRACKFIDYLMTEKGRRARLSLKGTLSLGI